MLGDSVAGDFKLKPVLIYHSQSPRALKNYVKSTLPVLYKWNNKAWMTAHLFTTWFTKYFKLTVETYCSERFLSKYYCSLTMHLITHYLMETYNDTNIVFMPVNTMPILQTMDQGVILTFKSYYLINIFQGLPWWHSGYESACQCRGHGFKPWSGKIPHAAEQLSSCATTTEPAL